MDTMSTLCVARLACHGFNALASGTAPDLRASLMPGSAEAFAAIVRDGALKSKGMPAFTHLTDDQLLKIRHFIRQQAKKKLIETNITSFFTRYMTSKTSAGVQNRCGSEIEKMKLFVNPTGEIL